MMPAFPTLSEQELDDVVSYVIHLSVRGETEYATMIRDDATDRERSETSRARNWQWLFDQNLLFVLFNWGVAAEEPNSDSAVAYTHR